MLKSRTYLLVMVCGIILTALSASHGAEVVVKLDRTIDGWVAWIPHQPLGTWTIQASPSGAADDWFSVPGYLDDGIRVYARVPNVPKMFFRAKRVR